MDEILNIFTERFVVAPYVSFALEVLVKYYIIIILLKWFSNKENEHKNSLAFWQMV